MTHSVQISHATEAAPGSTNEDRFRSGADWAVVLDGASRYPGRSGGCVHPVSWVVEHLAEHLATQLDSDSDQQLSAVLRTAIERTRTEHGPTCDLSNPLSPGATLAILRDRGGYLQWLVLGDCTIAIDRPRCHPIVVTDDRVDHLQGAPVVETEVRTYDPEYVATVRNQPGGFWIAGAAPEAAEHALTGEVNRHDVTRALLCSDGATRLTERHGWVWPDVFAYVDEHGPSGLIQAVRQADTSDPNPRRWRGKPHDDATVALVRFDPEGR